MTVKKRGLSGSRAIGAFALALQLFVGAFVPLAEGWHAHAQSRTTEWHADAHSCTHAHTTECPLVRVWQSVGAFTVAPTPADGTSVLTDLLAPSAPDLGDSAHFSLSLPRAPPAA
jgi:hypothetical protein